MADLRDALYKIVKVIYRSTGQLIDYDIDYVAKPQFYDNYIVIRFGMILKDLGESS